MKVAGSIGNPPVSNNVAWGQICAIDHMVPHVVQMRCHAPCLHAACGLHVTMAGNDASSIKIKTVMIIRIVCQPGLGARGASLSMCTVSAYDQLSIQTKL